MLKSQDLNRFMNDDGKVIVHYHLEDSNTPRCGASPATAGTSNWAIVNCMRCLGEMS